MDKNDVEGETIWTNVEKKGEDEISELKYMVSHF